MFNNNTCWQILGIEPVCDKKTIKRAYSQLLKITRPDDDTEGFKRLHTAYIEALSYVDAYVEDEIDSDYVVRDNAESGSGFHNIHTESIDSHIHTINTSADISSVEKTVSDTNVAQKIFYHQLEQLFYHQRNRHELLLWQNLFADEILYDITFKKYVSLYVLKTILDLRMVQIEATDAYSKLPRNFISPTILLYFNEYFAWYSDYEDIHDCFYYHDVALEQFYIDVCKAEEDVKKLAKTTYHVPSYNYTLATLHHRFFAFCIDAILASLVVVPVIWIFLTYSINAELIVFFLIGVGATHASLQANTIQQASIGQRLFNIRLINETKGRVSTMNAFMRLFVSVCSCCFFYFLVYATSVIGVLIILLYIVYKYYRKDFCTLIDIATNSYIIKNNE